MITKYNYLTDAELIRLVRNSNGDLVEELCNRLAKLLETNRLLVSGEFRK